MHTYVSIFEYCACIIYLHSSLIVMLIVAGLMPYQKSFLAWQVRSCYWYMSLTCNLYLFILLHSLYIPTVYTDMGVYVGMGSNEFFQLHPNYYVLPLRANGSSIETVFSQLKHGSRGTLTAVSYGAARAQLLTKRAVHGPHIREEYRSAPLYIQVPSKAS